MEGGDELPNRALPWAGEPLTASQARQVVEHLESLAEFRAGSRWAVVATKPASYGMLRMVAALADRVPMAVRVFSSREEAEAWLAWDAGDTRRLAVVELWYRSGGQRPFPSASGQRGLVPPQESP